ncbi:hypothetical protein K438DRAFT_2111312, partial [Mycena galopus ATCC 62051]
PPCRRRVPTCRPRGRDIDKVLRATALHRPICLGAHRTQPQTRLAHPRDYQCLFHEPNRRQAHCVPPHPLGALDVEAVPFKSRRFMPVFSELRYLCHTAPVQALIASHCEYISQFARTCARFMRVKPNKRAASAHVEYETDAWISVFNVTLSLSRVIKVYGEAFALATPAALAAAITTVVHDILLPYARSRRSASTAPSLSR